MERLLGAARELSGKVETNESAAGDLLRQCESLQEELRAMRQYRECIQQLNGGEQSRVRLPNIEFSYIKQLQHDNSELRTLLEEHQAALEMIMTKYRQQVSTFMSTDKVEGMLSQDHLAEELQQRTDQVYNMAAVMYRAAQVEDSSSQQMLERLAKLEYENRHLREVLQYSSPAAELSDRSQPRPAPEPGCQLQGGPQGGASVGSHAGQDCAVATPTREPCSEPAVLTAHSTKLNSLTRNEHHIAEGSGVANCVDRVESPCLTPQASTVDPVPLLELARERLADSVR